MALPHVPELSVVIPVYGSAGILPKLVQRLEECLVPAFPQGFEVVLVHDAGPDDAWAVITALAATHAWLVGIDLRKNAGQHNALMAGLSVSRGRYIVTMDDDLQHDPADVPAITACLRQGNDLCYAQFQRKQHALWKRVGSRFNAFVAQRLLNKPAGLYLSPFRGFVAALRDEVQRYHGPFVYLDGLLIQSTDRIATINVKHYPRDDGRSGYSLRKSVSLWLQMATSFSIMPLRFVSLAGIAASAAAFVIGVAIMLQKLRTPELAIGWPSLIVTILFMGGLQLLALGAIGEYTGRILLNVNNRPQYVIGKTINLASDASPGQS